MPFQLQRRHTLFAGCHPPEGIEPVTERNTAFLINRTDPGGVLLLAVIAFPKESLVATACLAVYHLVDVGRLTVNALGGVAPTLPFKEIESGGFIGASNWDLLDDRRIGQVMGLSFSHSIILQITQLEVK